MVGVVNIRSKCGLWTKQSMGGFCSCLSARRLSGGGGEVRGGVGPAWSEFMYVCMCVGVAGRAGTTTGMDRSRSYRLVNLVQHGVFSSRSSPVGCAFEY